MVSTLFLLIFSKETVSLRLIISIFKLVDMSKYKFGMLCGIISLCLIIVFSVMKFKVKIGPSNMDINETDGPAIVVRALAIGTTLKDQRAYVQASTSLGTILVATKNVKVGDSFMAGQTDDWKWQVVSNNNATLYRMTDNIGYWEKGQLYTYEQYFEKNSDFVYKTAGINMVYCASISNYTEYDNTKAEYSFTDFQGKTQKVVLTATDSLCLVFSNVNKDFYTGWKVCDNEFQSHFYINKIKESGYGYMIGDKIYSKNEFESKCPDVVDIINNKDSKSKPKSTNYAKGSFDYFINQPEEAFKTDGLNILYVAERISDFDVYECVTLKIVEITGKDTTISYEPKEKYLPKYLVYKNINSNLPNAGKFNVLPAKFQNDMFFLLFKEGDYGFYFNDKIVTSDQMMMLCPDVNNYISNYARTLY